MDPKGVGHASRMRALRVLHGSGLPGGRVRDHCERAVGNGHLFNDDRSLFAWLVLRGIPRDRLRDEILDRTRVKRGPP